ncbi:unnamed protein product [Medioppia subpectinata]|uniref:Uncharacterized protein n=1 Tax=Medioppia subpectinata TaxID=1979941 RepID=A0A7R9KEQ3_9ACAR|nr:unnamed protein product [Medioppia subpectinata]CAG2100957.1 unnamed protein product [Medioppia subpectinata]
MGRRRCEDMIRLLIVVIITLIVIQMAVRSQSSPIGQRFVSYLRSTDFNTEDNKCIKDAEYQQMCERCTKLSRNEYVFALCCAKDQGVDTWCEEYINYTID